MLTVQKLSYDSLRLKADAFLQKHHPSVSLPVPIEQIIESKFRIAIIPIPNLLKDFNIDGFLAADMSEISIDEFVYLSRENRARFTLAHELAHLLLHRSLLHGWTFRTIDEYKAFRSQFSDEGYYWLEWQGRSLAGLILAPSAKLQPLFVRAKAMAAKNGLDPEADPAFDYMFEWIGAQVGVSSQVIATRLYKDGCIPYRGPTDPDF